MQLILDSTSVFWSLFVVFLSLVFLVICQCLVQSAKKKSVHLNLLVCYQNAQKYLNQVKKEKKNTFSNKLIVIGHGLGNEESKNDVITCEILLGVLFTGALGRKFSRKRTNTRVLRFSSQNEKMTIMYCPKKSKLEKELVEMSKKGEKFEIYIGAHTHIVKKNELETFHLVLNENEEMISTGEIKEVLIPNYQLPQKHGRFAVKLHLVSCFAVQHQNGCGTSDFLSTTNIIDFMNNREIKDFLISRIKKKYGYEIKFESNVLKFIRENFVLVRIEEKTKKLLRGDFYGINKLSKKSKLKIGNFLSSESAMMVVNVANGDSFFVKWDSSIFVIDFGEWFKDSVREMNMFFAVLGEITRKKKDYNYEFKFALTHHHKDHFSNLVYLSEVFNDNELKKNFDLKKNKDNRFDVEYVLHKTYPETEHPKKSKNASQIKGPIKGKKASKEIEKLLEGVNEEFFKYRNKKMRENFRDKLNKEIENLKDIGIEVHNYKNNQISKSYIPNEESLIFKFGESLIIGGDADYDKIFNSYKLPNKCVLPLFHHSSPDNFKKEKKEDLINSKKEKGLNRFSLVDDDLMYLNLDFIDKNGENKFIVTNNEKVKGIQDVIVKVLLRQEKAMVYICEGVGITKEKKEKILTRLFRAYIKEKMDEGYSSLDFDSNIGNLDIYQNKWVGVLTKISKSCVEEFNSFTEKIVWINELEIFPFNSTIINELPK